MRIFKDLQLENANEEAIGELLGVFVGDGYIYLDRKAYKYSTRFFFNLTEEKYAKDLSDFFEENFSKKPNMRKEKYNRIITITYYTKRLYHFILEHVGWSISRNIIGHNKKSRTVFLKNINRSKKFKIGFLRGCLDSDGHISKNKINFASASKRLIETIGLFLEDVGIKNFNMWYYDDKRGNRVGIYHIDINRPERKRFIKTIKPRNRCKL